MPDPEDELARIDVSKLDPRELVSDKQRPEGWMRYRNDDKEITNPEAADWFAKRNAAFAVMSARHFKHEAAKAKEKKP